MSQDVQESNPWVRHFYVKLSPRLISGFLLVFQLGPEENQLCGELFSKCSLRQRLKRPLPPNAWCPGCPSTRRRGQARPCGLAAAQPLDSSTGSSVQHAATAPLQHHPALAQPSTRVTISLITGTNGLYFALLFNLLAATAESLAHGFKWSHILQICIDVWKQGGYHMNLDSITLSTSLLPANISSQKILAHKMVTYLQAPLNKTSFLQDGRCI